MANISKIRVEGVDYDIKDQELTTEVGKKADSSSLAKVATSGSYNDLSNKPTIPTAVTESTVSGWGFTKNTGTYSKPTTGIPKSDLASSVQTSLGKADTALQSYTEQYKGTVTGVKINGTTKSPSSGVVDLGTVVTDISGKQDKLVSGTNIKTINGESIVGSGNIEISGGGGSVKQVIELSMGSINISEMLPNVIYYRKYNTLSVSITSFATSDSAVDEYALIGYFNSGGEPEDNMQITLPEGVMWANGVIPIIKMDDEFELFITRKGNAYKAVLTPFKSAE